MSVFLNTLRVERTISFQRVNRRKRGWGGWGGEEMFQTGRLKKLQMQDFIWTDKL